MNDPSLFAAPREVDSLEDCYFYHVTELPGHGLVGTDWDLRGNEKAYLGGFSFAGKKVLELGTASGFLCRYMENQGAEVIGFDLSLEQSWDVVPFAALDMEAFASTMKEWTRRLHNSWWFAHRLFQSHARVVYGNVYDIPVELGPVDVSTLGALLLHLRDPFLALSRVARLTREAIIVTEVHPDQPPGSPLESKALSSSPENLGVVGKFKKLWQGWTGKEAHPGTMIFLPNPSCRDPRAGVHWWILPPEVVLRFLGVLGFEKATVTLHWQTYLGKKARLYTVVAYRTQPGPFEGAYQTISPELS